MPRPLATLLVLSIVAATPSAALAQAPTPPSSPEASAPAGVRPAGALHAGLQGAITLEWWQGNAGGPRDWLVERDEFIGAEVAPFVDLRVLREVHLRALAVVGLQRAQHAGREIEVGSGFFHAGGRLLVGFLPSSEVALRIGGELGMDLLLPAFRPRLYGGPMLEIALRFFDQENLEITLQLAVQSRAWHAYDFSGDRDRFGTVWVPRQGIAVAYLF